MPRRTMQPKEIGESESVSIPDGRLVQDLYMPQVRTRQNDDEDRAASGAVLVILDSRYRLST